MSIRTALATVITVSDHSGQGPPRDPGFAALRDRLLSIGRATPRHERSRAVRATTAVVAALVITWAAAILMIEPVRLEVSAPRLALGAALAGALTGLIGSLVLFLLPVGHESARLRWVGAGSFVLGLGDFSFGFLRLLLEDHPDLNTSMYASLMVWAMAGALLAVGLLPATAPPFPLRWALVALAAFGTLGGAIVVGAPSLPPLALVARVPAVDRAVPLDALTGWYWALAALPLGLAVAAVVGAAKRCSAKPLGIWLAVGLTLLAISQLHNLFWPSAYSSVLTTSELLRLAFTTIVVIAAERSTQLAAAQESSTRLSELAVLKADFTAMVAHELAAPTASIRRLADMLATGELGPEEQVQALATIQSEADALDTLVKDVRAGAAAERDDFAVRLRSVPVAVLLTEAAGFAKALPGRHPLVCPPPPPVCVWGDPDRLGQVLRNLLENAAKYSPSSTPIELRATRQGNRVRIEVVDHGRGIHPDDLLRIVQKYERGRDENGRRVPGFGLGLYLSRRIVQAHGSELTVKSTLGIGSVFGFTLDIVA